MIVAPLLLLIASAAALAARINATPRDIGCATHGDLAACVDETIPTTTKAQSVRTIRPVKGRALQPIEDVPSYTVKPKPTVKTRIGARATPTIVAIKERFTRPGDDHPTEMPTPTTPTKTKTKTRTRTTPTLVPIEERSVQPIENLATITVKPKPITTKTKTRTKTGPSIAPIEERSVQPTENLATITLKPKPITTKTKTRTKTGPSIAPIEGRSFLPIEDVPTFTVQPKPTITKTKTKTTKTGPTHTIRPLTPAMA